MEHLFMVLKLGHFGSGIKCKFSKYGVGEGWRISSEK
jgi:hypothetical protein